MVTIDTYLSEWVAHGPRPVGTEGKFMDGVLAGLPRHYLDFMERRNGGEGTIGSNYLILWRLEELASFNEECQVEAYAPGLFLIGSNGAGEGFGFDMRTPANEIVMIPFIVMNWNDVLRIGTTMQDLFRSLADETMYD